MAAPTMASGRPGHFVVWRASPRGTAPRAPSYSVPETGAKGRWWSTGNSGEHSRSLEDAKGNRQRNEPRKCESDDDKPAEASDGTDGSGLQRHQKHQSAQDGILASESGGKGCPTTHATLRIPPHRFEHCDHEPGGDNCRPRDQERDADDEAAPLCSVAPVNGLVRLHWRWGVHGTDHP